MDTVIQKDDVRKYIILNTNQGAGRESVCLGNEPIYIRKGIMANGTVACYCAKRANSKQWEFVVKFAWRLETDRPEEKHLAITMQGKVWGVVQFWDKQDIDSIASLRRALGYDTTKRTLVNWIFSYVVITPYGQALWQFKTTVELLMTFRDAIMAHKSLYQNGKILHQDISPENIIITETDNEEDPRRMLIDLIELDVGPEREGRFIGSRPFMAIKVLKRDLHTYCHDPESFFYVFLWAAVCDPKKFLLQRQASYIAGSKEAGVIWQKQRSAIWEKTNLRTSLLSFYQGFRSLVNWWKTYVRYCS